ncbi:sigma-70 family RNA polymerase sigma factor [Alienimonas californiensis]|uniref:RNA polymerase sigma factor SigM n=1 Tax=Alienimonas californiensis TaxID=2527989 RepID=A0A517PA78_9PLAN|nr:sigma-70 family RNA polymerase sigma factor [Alienimonas californiensis]QDT16274.1 RNA polymerase sigma factor SigM [Alienimonas californiensis]
MIPVPLADAPVAEAVAAVTADADSLQTAGEGVGPPEDFDEDDTLMIRLQGGDRAAFDELVTRHEGPLFGFFLKNVRNRALAEDLVQDTLLKVYRKNWDYLPTGRFRGWLYRIGRNLMIDAARRSRRDALVRSVRANADGDGSPLDRIAAEGDGPAAVAERRIFAELVDELLAELPDDQRETFTLHHFAHVPLPEVGQAMGVSTSTAKSRLRLAREKLRAKLAERGVRDPFEPDES